MSGRLEEIIQGIKSTVFPGVFSRGFFFYFNFFLKIYINVPEMAAD